MFLAWVERAGYQQLEDIEPITVAAYIETLQRQAAAPTVKQHMAAIRMLFSWLTEKGVLAMNPAREVKTERFWYLCWNLTKMWSWPFYKASAKQSRHSRSVIPAVHLRLSDRHGSWRDRAGSSPMDRRHLNSLRGQWPH